MKQEIQLLIKKLMDENTARSIKMNHKISDYAHTVLVHEYNNTLDIVKQLEKIIKKY
jgi:hypothetical protein